MTTAMHVVDAGDHTLDAHDHTLDGALVVDLVHPWELVAGDVILVNDAPYDVVSEPFNGVSGTSLFDSSELFWRARLRSVADPELAGYATWNVSDVVSLLQPGRDRK